MPTPSRLSTTTFLTLMALAVCLGIAILGAPAADAQSGCTTGSLRLLGAQGAGATTSNLVVLDPSTGAVQSTVGPIGFALTGMAAHPQTGVLYGVTAQTSAASPRTLITVNPATGQGTVVGPLNLAQEPANSPSPQTLTDLAFNSAGTLFGWSSRGGDLYMVNLNTGAASKVGESGSELPNGGGLTFGPNGTLYLSRHLTTGVLETINPTTGLATGSVQLSGMAERSVGALEFHPNGTLFGAALDISNPQPSNRAGQLITINPASGAITVLGSSLDRLDAIAFCGVGGASSTLQGQVSLQRVPTPSLQVVQLAVQLFAPQPGAQPGATPVATYQATTDQTGHFTVAGVLAGTYDVRVKQAQSISTEIEQVSLPAGGTTPILNFGTLLTGDADQNDQVTAADFTALKQTFTQPTLCATQNPIPNPCADFDANGTVGPNDFSLLKQNFGRIGPVITP
jgi:hypothetical protein